MKNFLRRDRGRGILDYAVIFLGLALVFWAGCNIDQVPGPELDQQDQEIVLSRDNVQVQVVMAIQERATADLLSKPGIVGTATGMTEDGRPAIVIMVVSEEASKAAALPEEIEAVPVIVMVTGEIKALKGPPGNGGGFDPTKKHRPAPNGVSLGHPDITAGTLGCLVESGNTTYILSNNHVMANENQAQIGDDILQPGTFDGGTAADRIAELSDFETIVFSTSANNVVDAAIAKVDDVNDVTGETELEGYGFPSSTIAPAAVGMDVRKYGRTSGQTETSTKKTREGVTAINATVNVGYASGVARFVEQIVITKRNYSTGGDSGSLIVDLNNNPVGLLFAGGSNITIANPISEVLSAFGVTIVSN